MLSECLSVHSRGGNKVPAYILAGGKRGEKKGNCLLEYVLFGLKNNEEFIRKFVYKRMKDSRIIM